MAMGHVILHEFHVDRQATYFADYARQYTDMPMLVRLVKSDGTARARAAPARLGFHRALGETNNPEWKTVAFDETSGEVVVPNGSIGFRWGEKGKWNLEEKDAAAAAISSCGCRWPIRRTSSPTLRFPTSAIASTIISPAPITRACWCARCR